jgi:hypothetical protein
MVYPPLSLRLVGLVVGLVLGVTHAYALCRPLACQAWLRAFPRSHPAGVFLLTICSIWAFLLIAAIDLGEFTVYRSPLLVLIPVAWFLSLKFADEFLAVRGLGMLLLLLAEPVLEATFLRPEGTRLLLVILAYGWVLKGLFWVGMPYLMRDQVAWIVRSPGRWTAACLLGLAYGAALVACALVYYPA